MMGLFLAGIRKAAGRPTLLIGVWLANFLVALPAAWVVSVALEDSFGSSRVAESMREGFDMAWYGEFEQAAGGVAQTFSPTQSGVGAFLINLEGWATGRLFDNFRGLLGLGLVWVLVWALLLGGVLTRYTDPAATKTGFFEAAGRYFARFVRLALLALPLYWLIYRLYRWCSARLADFTVDTTRESTVLMYSLIVILLIAFLLVLVRTCFDYAKIATVVEGRRSMILAALRGIGFVLANPGRTIGLYAIFAAVSAVALLLYAWIAPDAGVDTPALIWTAFAVGQAFLLFRWFLRLSLLAGETELYRKISGAASTVAAAPDPASPASTAPASAR